MKIWLPQLGRVYKTIFDGNEVFIRFSAYGVTNASSGRPIDLTFGVYSDIECKKSVADYNSIAYCKKRKEIYGCDFEDTGVVIEKLGKPKKQPTTVAELLHALSLKSNMSSKMDVKIIFREGITVPNWFYSYNCLVKKNDDGTYQYYKKSRETQIAIPSFTPDDVVEISGRLRGDYYRYYNGEINWR